MTQTKRNNRSQLAVDFIRYAFNAFASFIKIFAVQAGAAFLFVFVVLDEPALTTLIELPINDLIALKDGGVFVLFHLSVITTFGWLIWRDSERVTVKIYQILRTYRKAS
ncbi:hypothetical protein VII00023_20612 [Vibrio ichthyoenteri ATCC 700023]|uniref:Uncharacterized protein n=1 Tax=Vibrio ichthyoenteri ATCC 700023 TaxID=870968 RepID=F9S7T5_9VIBR|nr:hypothetical protein [Vibrio ichthyoenteri]EGU30985.1 hypothetical protein VII00023_20612 [Vibrio ichthyoenteri ATCC 700023]